MDKNFIYKNVETGKYFKWSSNDVDNLNDADRYSWTQTITGPGMHLYKRMLYKKEITNIRNKKLNKINGLLH